MANVGLPAISSNVPSDVRQFLDAVRVFISTSSSAGVTLQQLTNAGVVALDAGGNLVAGSAVGATGGGAGGTTLDLTPPPTPSGLTASGALTHIMLSWDDPQYANLAYTEIWRADVDNIGVASLVGMAAGVMYTDAVTPGVTHYYWIRFMSQAGVIGPYNAIAGTVGQTSQDPAPLLGVLAGAITGTELSTALNTNIAQIGTNTTAIQTTQSAVDGVNALYAVKMDNNGYVSGFGLTSSLAAGGTPTSTFIANVNTFAVTAPSTSIPAWAASTVYAVGKFVGITGNTAKMLVCKVPGTSGTAAPSIAGAIGLMVVDGTVTWQIASRVPISALTTTQTINGVSVLPGVYIDGATIVNGTIQNAQIANLAVDNAKIASLSVDKLLAGSLAASQYIQSSNYVAGTTGFRINADGTAEFSNITARGNIQATSFSAITLAANQHIKYGQTAYNTGTGFFLGDNGAGTPVFSLGMAGGNGLTWDGTGLIINGSGTFSGAVYASSGSFSGSLSAATGTFSGSLSGADISGATGTFSGALAAGVVDITKVQGTVTEYKTVGTYTITVPADKTSLTVTLVGGGGGGGGGSDWTRYGTGGGGGSGGVTTVSYSGLTPGATYTIVVGAGGAGGSYVDYPYSNPGQNAGNGVATTLANSAGTIIATAPGGGKGNNPFNTGGTGLGGAAGNALASAGSQGADGNSGWGGDGGGSAYGSGGAGGIGWQWYGQGPGKPGAGYGGGGGGGGNFSRPSSGGAGSGGYARVEFFNPNSVVLQTDFAAFKTILGAQGLATVAGTYTDKFVLPTGGQVGAWGIVSYWTATTFGVGTVGSGNTFGLGAGTWRCHTATATYEVISTSQNGNRNYGYVYRGSFQRIA